MASFFQHYAYEIHQWSCMYRHVFLWSLDQEIEMLDIQMVNFSGYCHSTVVE